MLRDLNDELDAAVAEAYGWPWPMETEEMLERLVALHDERVLEEKRGLVRWLRPEYQIPRFGERVPSAPEAEQEELETTEAATQVVAWPDDAIEHRHPRGGRGACAHGRGGRARVPRGGAGGRGEAPGDAGGAGRGVAAGGGAVAGAGGGGVRVELCSRGPGWPGSLKHD